MQLLASYDGWSSSYEARIQSITLHLQPNRLFVRLCKVEI